MALRFRQIQSKYLNTLQKRIIFTLKISTYVGKWFLRLAVSTTSLEIGGKLGKIEMSRFCGKVISRLFLVGQYLMFPPNRKIMLKLVGGFSLFARKHKILSRKIMIFMNKI